MTIRWLPRFDQGDKMQPVLAIVTSSHWFGLRFGRENYKSFSERHQGTRGIPTQWHYLFGGRISWTFKPYPDDRKYPRFETT